MDNPFSSNTPDWFKALEKRQSQKPTKAEIKAQKKAAQDRDIMRALKNYINANTCDYLVHIAGSNNTKNELTYLASRSKQAGVDKEIAWECSKEFLKHRFPEFDEDVLREGFEFHYDYEIENPKYRGIVAKNRK